MSLPTTAIERTSPVPFWFQLTRVLTDEIIHGRWVPGHRLASEPELGEHFGVSRSVVRQALARLEAEGLVRREKGRGTYVAENQQRSWLLQSSEGFFQDEVERLGLSVTSRILRAEEGRVPAWAAEALGVPSGSPGVTIARLRCVEGKVALYNVNYLLSELADTVLALEPDASLYEAVEREHGLAVVGGRRVVEAVAAGEELGRLLEVPAGAALAFIESVSWDAELRPFDCYQTWLRTDRTRIEVQVARSSGAASLGLAALSREIRP